MSCSLRLKHGEIEIEYSGEESFAEKNLKGIIDALTKSIEQAPAPEPKPATQEGKAKVPGFNSSLTTSTAATKLGAKSGTDLAKAAAYVLHTGGKDQFTRAELLTEMREAKSYFRVNYSKNLTPSLDTLVKQGTFLHQGGENYALSVDGEAELGKKFS